MSENKVVALIPARFGSKGLPNKNLLEIAGKSITELAVIQGEHVADIVILSTDIPYFIDGKKFEKAMVHKRNEALASDRANMDDVILDVIEAYGLKDCTMILLQPTSPLRTISNIEECIEKFNMDDCELLMSVTETTDNGFKFGVIDNGRFKAIRSQSDLFKNRQELPSTYKHNGAVYVFNTDRVLKASTIASDNIKCVEMSVRESIDIDSFDDYELAKELYET